MQNTMKHNVMSMRYCLHRLLAVLLAATLCAAAMAATGGGKGRVSLRLEGEPLPSALKKIEKQGGKSILFTYKETERYRVTATIRNRTQAEAMAIVLDGKPFSFVERDIYFVVQYDAGKKEQARVRGQVTDAKGRPLAFATVMMLDKATGRLLAGCVTAGDGTFVLPSLPGRPARLKVSFVGFKTAVVDCRADNSIRLADDTKLLKGVTVKDTRPMIEHKGGSIMANVQGTVLSMFGSAAEMIGHLPFVVNDGGGFNVIGRGAAEVYINSRKVRNSGDLERLRAEDIVSAEIIMNPGARYSSSTGAVIRLKTVKKRGDGLSGRVFAEWNQGRRGTGNESVWLNYRTGGLDVFASGHTAHEDSYSAPSRENRVETSSVWRNITRSKNEGHEAVFDGELGFNYEPDARQSLGVRYATYTHLGDKTERTRSQTEVYRDGEKVEDNVTNTSTAQKDGWNHSVNAYYTGTFGKWGIDFNADYYGNKRVTSLSSADLTGDNAASDNTVRSDMYAAKLVISATLGKSSVAFGTEETFTNRRDAFTQNGFAANADDKLLQSYYSAFADYSVNLGKLSLRAGLRYELQRTRYYQFGKLVRGQSPTYSDLMPSASVSYSGGGWAFSLAYRTMKFSPAYDMLASSISYKNKYLYYGGDPNLKPQYHYKVSLDAGWKWILVNVWYDYIKDEYTTFFRPYDPDGHPGALLHTMASIPYSNAYGASVSLMPKIGLWQPNLQVTVYRLESDYRPLGSTKHWRGPRTRLSLDNSFMFSHGWFVNLYCSYMPYTRSNNVVDKACGYIDMRVRKTLLKDNSLNITLGVNDLLKTNNQPFIMYGDRAYSDIRYNKDSRRVFLAVTYSFNMTKNKYRGKGAGQAEKNRL